MTKSDTNKQNKKLKKIIKRYKKYHAELIEVTSNNKNYLEANKLLSVNKKDLKKLLTPRHFKDLMTAKKLLRDNAINIEKVIDLTGNLFDSIEDNTKQSNKDDDFYYDQPYRKR